MVENKTTVENKGKYPVSKVYMPIFALVITSLLFYVVSKTLENKPELTDIIDGKIISIKHFSGGTIGISSVPVQGEKIKVKIAGGQEVEVLDFSILPCLDEGQGVKIGVYKSFFGFKTEYKLHLQEK